MQDRVVGVVDRFAVAPGTIAAGRPIYRRIVTPVRAAQALPLEKAPETALQLLVRQKIRTLEDVTTKLLDRNRELPRLLGCRPTVSEVASALVAQALISSVLPANHRINTSRGSLYFDASIVGETQFASNLRAYAESKYQTLDDCAQIDFCLAAALKIPRGLQHSSRNLARALIARGILSSKLPDDHPIAIGGKASYYIDPAVVGSKVAAANMRLYVRTRVVSLDNIGRASEVLASYLELPDLFPVERSARACIKKNLLKACPKGRFRISTDGSRLSVYLRPAVVGKTQAVRNLSTYLVTSIPNLDEVIPSKALGAALLSVYPKLWDKKESAELALGQAPGICRAIIKISKLSPELPQNHPAQRRSGAPTRYFDAAIVGESQARENLRRFATEKYPSLDDMSRDRMITSRLGFVGDCPLAASKQLIANGWASAARPQGIRIAHGTKPSVYILEEVVGREMVMANLRGYFQEFFGSASRITDGKRINAFNTVCDILGVSRSAVALRNEILRLGWLAKA